MWEYKRVDFKYKNTYELDNLIQTLGNENWEIISYIDVPVDAFEKFLRVKILAKRLKINNKQI